MKLTAWIGRLVLCFALSLGLAFQVRGQTAYTYAYMVQHTPDEVAFHFLNGAEPQTIAIPVNSIIQDAALSPTADWIALGFYYAHEIALFNFSTHETRLIAGNPGYSLDSNFSQFYKFQRLAWSPDGQNLAFTSYENGVKNIFVYSTVTDEMTKLTSDETLKARVVWDHTGTRLASVVVSCDADEYCHTSIEIHDTVSQSVSLSSPIAEGYGNWGDTQVCDLKWSPDDRYLSYIKTCGVDIGGIKEVYLLDTSNGTIHQATALTVESLEANDSPYLVRFGVYSPLWLDDTHLIIGVAYTTPENAAFAAPLDVRYSIDTMTIVYDVTEQTTSTLLESEMGQHWALDTNTHRVAFLTTTDSHYPSNSPIRVGTLDANGFQPDTTLPAGCDIAWSPDGTALAFTLLEVPRTNCESAARSIAIYDVITAQQQIFTAADDEWIRPIGWVQTSTP